MIFNRKTHSIILILSLFLPNPAFAAFNLNYFQTLLRSSNSSGLKKLTDMIHSASIQELNEPDEEEGYTPLLLAIERKREDIAQLLLEKGVNVGLTNKDYPLTPLHLAAKNNLQKVTQALIQKGANVNAVTDTQDRLKALYRALYSVQAMIPGEVKLNPLNHTFIRGANDF